MIVPVWVATQNSPETERLVYALLDTQSDTTFNLDHTAEMLNAHSEDVVLKLTTMTSRDELIHCKRYNDITVRGFYSDLTTPTVYSRSFIPVNKSHIPTVETANNWPHLQSLAHKMPPVQDCEIGLLIGYNCPQALAPRSCITGKDNQPFAIETDLGWSVVGCTATCEDSGDAIGLSHKVITIKVPEELRLSEEAFDVPEGNLLVPQEVCFVYQTKIKEVMNPSRVLEMFEQDFNEHGSTTASFSQEDRRFLTKVKKGIHQREDGHYEMPLPFKEERPLMPNNIASASQRLNQLKRLLEANKKYCDDNTRFMGEVIEKGDAEKVRESELEKKTVWYIPHHGVYHPQKPDKIRVVFDCSAKFKGTSLNDHVLSGPDLTNTLTGVLCRFRQESIAFMCDVERMFHQFHVDPEDRDYHRFLWWENGNLDYQPVEYRMNVHLFGAASSPGCANFGLKYIASENEGQFGTGAADFVRRNFYVDDGLRSVDAIPRAVEHVNNAREMCSEGALSRHKFVSNNRELMESVPQSERAKDVDSLDLTFEDLPVERALGIQWCIQSDEFNFRITLKDRPLTWRGVLSTVASLFDPFGFLAPFVLRGKQILQHACRDGVDWDDPLPEELQQKWERWRQELPDLASIRLARCFKPEGFGQVQTQELHHFSDASTRGYGQCSYLRLMDENGNVHCSLVMGKARVTPRQIVTIPRLELTAAVVSLRVSTMMREELDVSEIQEFCWTDSATSTTMQDDSICLWLIGTADPPGNET